MKDGAEEFWPNGKRIAVVFNICLEAWSEGKAPGITPMGNPLPADLGLVDTMAISWAQYGMKTGIYRLLEGHSRNGVKATIVANAAVAERQPQSLKAAATEGHEISSHSYAMDIFPAALSEGEERENIARCTDILGDVAGVRPVGWLSPRATASSRTKSLIADAGYRWFGDELDEDLPRVDVVDERPLVVIPFDTDVNDMPGLKYGVPPTEMLTSFVENIQAAESSSSPSLINVTTHAQIAGRLRAADVYSRILQEASENADLWLTTRAEIADHMLSKDS